MILLEFLKYFTVPAQEMDVHNMLFTVLSIPNFKHKIQVTKFINFKVITYLFLFFVFICLLVFFLNIIMMSNEGQLLRFWYQWIEEAHTYPLVPQS